MKHYQHLLKIALTQVPFATESLSVQLDVRSVAQKMTRLRPTPQFATLLYFWLTLALVSRSTATIEPQCIETDEDYVSHGKCGIYLAPSTIPKAGLGIFSGVQRRENETIDLSDPCIPIIEPYFRPGNRSDVFRNPFLDYVWNGREMRIHQLTKIGATSALCTGLDAAVNSNLALINLAKGRANYYDSDLHRSRDPGAGAQTPYHVMGTLVLADIPPGGELFKSYGDQWYVMERLQVFFFLASKGESDNLR